MGSYHVGLDTLTLVTSQYNLSLQKAINSDDSYERVNLAAEELKGIQCLIFPLWPSLNGLL